MAAWRNGIASDYESGDCRFDPCGGHIVFLYFSFIRALSQNDGGHDELPTKKQTCRANTD